MKKNNIIILGIETSCDETSASLLIDGRVLSNVILSQIGIHRKYSGVVPELASRAHLESVNTVVSRALKSSGLGMDRVSAIAYTAGPGLAGSLLVGAVCARTLSYINNLPLIQVNHLEGHIYSAMIENKDLKPPFMALVVSGGHTELIIVRAPGKYEILGGTRDDAAGEAYDKVAKLLSLGYPGGPVIDRLSKNAVRDLINFPRPYLKGTWDFSFSGLKTAVVNHLNSKSGSYQNSLKNKTAVASAFQNSVVDTLVSKAVTAMKQFGISRLALGGGVSSNSALRRAFTSASKANAFRVFMPGTLLCTDNAAMIAYAGYLKLKNTGDKAYAGADTLASDPGLILSDWKY
ncbi:MAG TPA: tRNA (adenosine(37)-N6)-threonylcarbamoyltransferase complex transferase subunit TsaD [Elusimicrobia bacterium]|nr:MAG: tRNA (adenosine(37)-N6)-threonylcarbamoyltransferase complex transferase subunit TsaD [Elusimicrobia bacterium RIFOXYA12_FULL_49_49]OGS06215.1 MAG: tRNA (adenosine(37)-N6)-threonylcarbamoyltransferase complex transferase subunit TsaD [Elusimicrobia bacterium RIFOXYA1_FULL_47_7]OGS10676.1 MAG: tRNA (adenosine(37)-N6)-threonylcarbamoyltransferase complex transferase subunit TsaD [Elusimicrobia bacterium RIFOXYB1_FULL_48_9]OGS16876.1 MAG: tRNA (adenosine(37)-N6)-threonylcarbamoyltransferase